MLHTVNKSPYSHQHLADCLRLCDTDDVVVLIEDGVYAALANGEWIESLFEKVSAIYVLQPDVDARGLNERIAASVIRINYDGFVQLCIDQPKMLAWY